MTTFKRTDYGNAERLVHYYSGIIRYSPERNVYYIFNGKYWKFDIGNIEVTRLAKKMARYIYKEAYAGKDSGERAKISKHAASTERQQRLVAMINSAESEPGVAILLAAKSRIHDFHTGCKGFESP